MHRLDVFGSATSESFDVHSSDVDILVEFDVSPRFDYVNAYFGLKEGLEKIFQRTVDLVSVTAIRNPYFRDTVMSTRENLYAA